MSSADSSGLADDLAVFDRADLADIIAEHDTDVVGRALVMGKSSTVDGDESTTVKGRICSANSLNLELSSSSNSVGETNSTDVDLDVS